MRNNFMRISTMSVLFMGSAIVLLLGSAAPLFGQKGQNAVIKSGGQVNSIAFIDASKYESTQRDICITIQQIFTDILNNNPKVTVDARGSWSPGNLTCAATENPWSPSTPTSNVVLLPAATITISSTWTLPQNTRLIGAGSNATIIQAGSGLNGQDMIDMGNIVLCPVNNITGFYDCQGVVIEHLGLSGGVNGIVNQFSEELSYVDDITLTGMTGIGLELGTYTSGNNKAAGGNSGPYSNISFVSPGGTCVSINGVTTRGIHGLTCITTSSTSGPLVYLDGYNNSLEDLTLAYVSNNDSPPGPSLDGILVGSQNSGGAQSNILMNVSGSNLANVVHISNATSGTSICPPGGTGSNSVYNVCDLTIVGVSGGSVGRPTIRDDLSSTNVIDPTVGIYVLGEQVVQGASYTPIGYSRITSSPSVPTWLVGSVAPPSGTGTCATGALYSCTGTTSECTNSLSVMATIWGCAGTAWVKIK
jgi:hypothetical protein